MPHPLGPRQAVFDACQVTDHRLREVLEVGDQPGQGTAEESVGRGIPSGDGILIELVPRGTQSRESIDERPGLLLDPLPHRGGALGPFGIEVRDRLPRVAQQHHVAQQVVAREMALGFGARRGRPFLGAARLDEPERRADDPGDQGDQQRAGRGEHAAIPPRELAQPIGPVRRRCEHGLVQEMTLDVPEQVVGRRVATVGLLVHRLQHDPIEVAAQRPLQRLDAGRSARGDRRTVRGGGQSAARWRRLGLQEQPVKLARGRAARVAHGDWQLTDQQLVEHDAEGVDVGARVDLAALGLLGRHVPRACRPSRRSR